MGGPRRRTRGFRWTPDDAPAAAAVETGVHEARKLLKRVRALLAFVRPVVGAEATDAFDARARDVGRRLSGTRDGAARVAALDRACGGHDGVPARFEGLRAALLAARDARTEAFLRSDDVALAVDALQALADDLRALALPADGLKRWDRGLRRLIRRGRASLDAAAASPDDAHAHAVRRRWKQLGYVLRWLAPACPDLMGPYARALETALTALGDDHDQVVLRARLERGVDGAAPEVLAEALEGSIAYGERRRAGALEALARLAAEPAKAFVARQRAYVAHGRGAGRDGC
ncbi:MAG: CHAD domain-containing protein [Trueperaceae bacterium]|nr:CHAD domain-containing protein [Trueperaceae bacterium]